MTLGLSPLHLYFIIFLLVLNLHESLVSTPYVLELSGNTVTQILHESKRQDAVPKGHVIIKGIALMPRSIADLGVQLHTICFTTRSRRSLREQEITKKSKEKYKTNGERKVDFSERINRRNRFLSPFILTTASTTTPITIPFLTFPSSSPTSSRTIAPTIDLTTVQTASQFIQPTTASTTHSTTPTTTITDLTPTISPNTASTTTSTTIPTTAFTVFPITAPTTSSNIGSTSFSPSFTPAVIEPLSPRPLTLPSNTKPEHETIICVELVKPTILPSKLVHLGF